MIGKSYAKKEKIFPAYVSKRNSNRDKQFILLIIPNGERWNYLAVKKISALLREITSKHHGDFLMSQLPSLFCNRKQT